MELNVKDKIIQAHFPTVMVPKFGDLPECEIGKTRLLIAQGGLYLETNQPWGRLVHQLYEAPRSLPYGEIEESDDFDKILIQAFDIIYDEMVPTAAVFAEQNKEWAGWIVWDEQNGLEYMPVTFESTYVTAEVQHPKLPEGKSLVIDVHSHGTIPPGFSGTDDRDDKGGVYIALVLGNYNGNKAGMFDINYRYCVEGFLIGSYEREENDNGCTDDPEVD